MRATLDIERYSAKMEAAVPKAGLNWRVKTSAAHVQEPKPVVLKPITFRRRTEAERADLRKHNVFYLGGRRAYCQVVPLSASIQ